MAQLPGLPHFNLARGPLPDAEPAPSAPPPMQMVEVVNRNTFVMQDRFDGVPYTFKPNVPISITPQAARHFFGWPAEGEIMKLWTCRRFGWNTPDHITQDKNRPHDERTVADIYFENLDIKTIEYEMVRKESSVPMPEDHDLADRPDMDERAAAEPDREPRGDPTGEVRSGAGRHARTRTPRKMEF
jgi:hypothetical protein